MIRICLVALILMCISVFVDIASAQNGDVGGATIGGEVFDATPEQNPISDVDVIVVNSATGQEYTANTNIDGIYKITGLPAGRYTASYSKKGYGNRIGKSKVVVDGGEIYDRVILRKKETIVSFLMTELFTWQLFVGIAIGAIAMLILLSLISRV